MKYCDLTPGSSAVLMFFVSGLTGTLGTSSRTQPTS